MLDRVRAVGIVASIACMGASIAAAQPAVSAELAPEPVTTPWTRQARVAATELDLFVGGGPGVLDDEGAAFLAYLRVGGGGVRWLDSGGLLTLHVDVEGTYPWELRVGLHASAHMRAGPGLALSVQTRFDDVEPGVGVCYSVVCVEGRVFGLATGDRDVAVTAGVTMSMGRVRRGGGMR